MESLKIAFELLAYGWGGTFLVLLIIYVSAKVLVRILPPDKK